MKGRRAADAPGVPYRTAHRAWLRGRPEPRRVLYIANSAAIGGGNRALMDLVTGVDRTRFMPSIVAPGEGPLRSWAKTRRVRCWVMSGPERTDGRGMAAQAARLAALMLRTRPSIVHAMAPRCYRPAGLAGALTRTARVCHLGAPPTAHELEWGLRFGPEAVIACYEQQALEAQALLQASKPRCQVIAIANGVDVNTFGPAHDAQSSAASRRFSADFLVVTVANLVEVKGYPTLLRAAAKVISERDKCAFVIVGEEPNGKGCRAQIEGLLDELRLRGRVHLLGWDDNVAELLRAADLMALPSLAEGLPLAVLEAMACGRPVVATTVGGIPEAVVDGLTGLLVKPGDASALSNAILRLLNNPDLARSMGKEGRKRVEKHFSLERVISQVHELYDDLLDGKR